jgi:predicted nucleic acid-binding protein
MKLCDTNIFIEIFKNNALIVSAVEQIISQDRILISDVVRAELFFGARDKRELQLIRKYLNGMEVLPVQANMSTMAVELVEQYCLSHKLTFHDALIATTAIFHDVELYTLNIKDFIFIPRLKLYQPN